MPVDNNIFSFKVNVTASVGRNSLQFEGAGVSDGKGLTIDKVSLIRVGSANNIVVNGDFEVPAQNGGWNFQNDIPGWTGKGIKIGWGDLFNTNWNSQVIELDGSRNYEITQLFTFDSSLNLVANIQQYTPPLEQSISYIL